MERLKAIAGISGVLAALIALAGLFVSSRQWVKNTELAREQRVEERLDGLFEALSAESPATRFAAIGSLRAFIEDTESRRHVSSIFAAIVSVIAIDESPQVRRAAIALVRELAARTNDCNAILALTIDANRDLAAEAGLLGKLAPRSDGRQTPAARATDLASVIAILLRRCATTGDLAHLYLANVDFSNMNLSGVSFQRSVLSGSRFVSACAAETRFDDSILDETDFAKADLRRASFRQTRRDVFSETKPLHYVAQQLESFVDEPPPSDDEPRKSVVIAAPSFRCANLREADFTGHALFAAYERDAASPPVFSMLNFEDADLADAELWEPTLYGIVSAQQRPHQLMLPIWLDPLERFTRTPTSSWFFYGAPKGGQFQDKKAEQFALNVNVLEKSNWNEAHLHPGIAAAMEHYEVPGPNPKERRCRPRNCRSARRE